MNEPVDSDRSHDAMQVFIQADSIRGWTHEAFYWPSFTIAVATLVYTLAEWWAESGNTLDINKFKVSGELVGAGGVLFSALLLKSMESRLKEWQKEARPYYTNSFHVAEVKKHIEDSREWITLAIATAMVLTWISVIAQVYIVHHALGHTAFEATVALFAGNAFLAIAVWAFCLTRLYRAKQAIIAIHSAYLADRFLPPPRLDPGEAGPGPASTSGPNPAGGPPAPSSEPSAPHAKAASSPAGPTRRGVPKPSHTSGTSVSQKRT